MKLFIPVCLFLLIQSYSGFSQKPTLDYYLPTTSYDASIPTPESILGYQVGEWHVSHDQLAYYMKALAAASPRVQIEEYARSHEGRPLLLLTITTPENQKQLENIRQEHLKLSQAETSAKMNIEKLPAVVYQGYSIHGNESSGANAALLVAYYLAAGQGEAVEQLLEKTIVLLDPCYNPDGLHRFSSWVNMHQGKNKATHAISREFNETWPGGRTNHYWFDLNRDWLLLTHPESQGRIRNFHRWKPNILTDHHEMGSNSTFFFQPGVPARTNPITPQRNQELTGKIAEFHARALDEIGSLYYSKESFDDFYYGKGSTYPDVNGCIGILFEQASSRGHLRQTNNGLLSFPFTIRNQVRTSLSTLESAKVLRKDLLEYQRDFYQSAEKESQKGATKAYVFSSADESRLYHFVDLLQQHQIDVYPLKKNLKVAQKEFNAKEAYVVPLAQAQYRLVKAVFGTSTSFRDSIFYDVSAWTMPLAFDLNYTSLDAKAYSNISLETALTAVKAPSGKVIGEENAYGYLFSWDGYYAPKALYSILDQGLRAKLATQTFVLPIGKENLSFDAGTIFIPTQNQQLSQTAIAALMKTLAEECGIAIYATATGSTPTGIDLGSPSFSNLKKPKVLLVVGNGVSSYDAGEVWHLLDTRYGLPVSMVEGARLGEVTLDTYSTIIMTDGSHGRISSSGLEKMKNWLQNGGTIVAMERAVRWMQAKGLAKVKFKKERESKSTKDRRPYNRLGQDEGAGVIGGAIFKTKLDLTNPLCFGFEDEELPVFRQGRLFMELPDNVYASPVIYHSAPLMSGYVSDQNLKLIKNSAAMLVSSMGRGRVICMADNPNFRGFWYGTNKLFANAVFFGGILNRGAAE